MNGYIAPPEIPAIIIPDTVPWFFVKELRANAIIIDHILEIDKPKHGIAITAIHFSPNNPKLNIRIDRQDKKISSFLESTNLIKIRPINVPTVILPQKNEITFAPSFWGSRPWYEKRNWDAQVFIPCSVPT